MNNKTMNSNFDKGLNFEQKAMEILKKKGLTIIGHRIHSRFGEIDILAQYKNDYYLIEVKFRADLINASYALNKKQLKRSLDTFYFYAQKENLKYQQIYFLAIIMENKKYKIINIFDL